MAAELLEWRCTIQSAVRSTSESDVLRTRSQVPSSSGKPYRDLSSDEFATLLQFRRERHKPFNWLCGYSPIGRWEDTDRYLKGLGSFERLRSHIFCVRHRPLLRPPNLLPGASYPGDTAPGFRCARYLPCLPTPLRRMRRYEHPRRIRRSL